MAAMADSEVEIAGKLNHGLLSAQRFSDHLKIQIKITPLSVFKTLMLRIFCVFLYTSAKNVLENLPLHFAGDYFCVLLLNPYDGCLRQSCYIDVRSFPVPLLTSLRPFFSMKNPNCKTKIYELCVQKQ
jgi:hypothetical protein